MNELKTLKDIANKIVGNEAVKYFLRTEAIKWVKEDLMEQAVGFDKPSPFLKKWMKRLDITEEDLKSKKK